MECINDHALDLLFMAAVLLIFALAGLVWTAIHMRRAVLGGMLLKACADDWQSARLAIDNAAEEMALMTHRDPRVRRRWFHRDMNR